MSDPFVAEIRIFPFNFAPKGWAFCDGQLLPLSQNTALFSLLGTTYGGDGKSTFALPDFQGSSPIQPGQAAGGSLYDLGQQGGSQFITLLESEMPSHNHTANPKTSLGNQATPAAFAWAGSQVAKQYVTTAPNATMSPFTIGIAGGSVPHNNMQPYLTLNFCIALQGVFPPRQ
jgi:microcystin-dependent protein